MILPLQRKHCQSLGTGVNGMQAIFHLFQECRENFVEAHHLVPMQFQNEFGARLDVVETLLSRARRVAACFITGVQRNLKAGSRFNTYSASRFL